MYQQTLGRFLSRDPMAVNGVDVLSDGGFYGDRLAAMRANPWYYGGNGENLFAYVNNNPVNYTDPSGLFALTGSGLPSISDCASWATITPQGANCLPIQCDRIVSQWLELISSDECRNCYKRKPCTRTRPQTGASFYGCFCGEGNSANSKSWVNPQPMDALDACCEAHDDAWDLIKPPCNRFSPVSRPDPKPECRAADRIFCNCLSKVDCSKTVNPGPCRAYRSFAMSLAACRDFNLRPPAPPM